MDGGYRRRAGSSARGFGAGVPTCGPPSGGRTRRPDPSSRRPRRRWRDDEPVEAQVLRGEQQYEVEQAGAARRRPRPRHGRSGLGSGHRSGADDRGRGGFSRDRGLGCAARSRRGGRGLWRLENSHVPCGQHERGGRNQEHARQGQHPDQMTARRRRAAAEGRLRERGESEKCRRATITWAVFPPWRGFEKLLVGIQTLRVP